MKEKQRFQRVVVSREEALSMFQENKFKVEIITGLPEDATISLYRCAWQMQILCSLVMLDDLETKNMVDLGSRTSPEERAAP